MLTGMRIMKRIGLFFITAGIMFSAGSYVTLKADQFFYPNKYGQQREKEPPASLAETEMEERVIAAAVEEIPVITADTTYLIEEVNLSDGTIQEKEEKVPVKYIGLDRNSLIEELKAYDQNPALRDLELGFQTIELSGFSRDRVVICKYYRPEEEEEGFYLMVADHYVIVYKADRKTIYMNTDILLSSLSSELQAEIIRGKYMEDERTLYNFLESYSS